MYPHSSVNIRIFKSKVYNTNITILHNRQLDLYTTFFKKLSSSTATKVGSAIKTAGSASKEAADVARAEQIAEKVRADIAALNRQLEKEIADLDTSFDAQTEELAEIVVRAKSTDIHVAITGLAWLPYTKGESGRLKPAW